MGFLMGFIDSGWKRKGKIYRKPWFNGILWWFNEIYSDSMGIKIWVF